jgi:hypothetical protein
LPQLDAIEDIPEDGPLFKAHCKGMEERAYYLRRSLKHVVRSAEAVAHAGRLLDEAEDALDRSLHEVAEYSPNSIRALNEVYWDTARRVQGFARKEALLRLEELVIEPLRRLITILKAADTKKKAYEQESKAFYEHVHKVRQSIGLASSDAYGRHSTSMSRTIQAHPKARRGPPLQMRSTRPRRIALQ